MSPGISESTLWDPLSKGLVTSCHASAGSAFSHKQGHWIHVLKCIFHSTLSCSNTCGKALVASLGFTFGPFQRGRKGKLCHVEIFPSGHSNSTCKSLWRDRRNRGKGKSPSKPNANHISTSGGRGASPQPCSSGAASVPAWLPRQEASRAGRINKRWSVRLCFPSTGLQGRLLTLCWRQQWLQHLVSKKCNFSVKSRAKEGNRKGKANESEKWLRGRINIYSKNPQAPTGSV